MLNSLKFLPVPLLLTFLTACSSSGLDATVIPTPSSTTANPVEINGKVLIGGSMQVKGAVFTSVSSVSTLAGTPGTAGGADTNTSTGTVARFNQPTGITTDGTNLYVADYNNHTIRMIDMSGIVSNFVGTPGVPGSENGNENGVGAFFNYPSAITTDGTNLYVADSYNFTIRKINITSKKVELVAGLAGSSGSADADLGPNARFNILSGITTDGTNLYVTDSNNTIRRIVISNGATSTLAGTAGVIGSDDGTGTAAKFNLPARITTDGSVLYVTDFNNRTIRKITLATQVVETIVGNADAAPGRTDATDLSGRNALFYQLNGITMDGTNLYVTDSYNNTVYKINKITLLATKLAGITGTAGRTNTIDGIPTFDTPIGITTDGTSLYVTDSRNHTIRKIQ